MSNRRNALEMLDRADSLGANETEISRGADVITPDEEHQLPLRHREVVEHMKGEATELDVPIRDIAGTAVSEHKRVVGWGLATITIVDKSLSYRSGDALIPPDAGEGFEWVTVNPSTTLRTLLKKYGDRLHGYDSVERTRTLEIVMLDIFNSTEKSVRVLVRRPDTNKVRPESGPWSPRGAVQHAPVGAPRAPHFRHSATAY